MKDFRIVFYSHANIFPALLALSVETQSHTKLNTKREQKDGDGAEKSKPLHLTNPLC